MGEVGDVHPSYRASAPNLLHYLALHRQDIRPLQERLARLGLSSLGRSEPNVLANVEAVIKVLHFLENRPWARPAPNEPLVDFAKGQALLARHTEDLLGSATAHRNVRIMVTIPSEAADDYALVHGLLAAGMDCMRINCTHDDTTAWGRMIAHLRRAEQTLVQFQATFRAVGVGCV
jgi:pyruvate kinase